ncbi:DnaJ family domain-containing protein [Lentzea chajnantorensis]
MTQRKPHGMDFESWIDRQIREAQERGEFDGLPSAGKPLPGAGEPLDEDWWIKRKVREEEGTAGLPPSLVLRKEAESAKERALTAPTDEDARAIIEAINARILDALRKPLSGPPLNLMPFNVEKLVRERKGTSRTD